MTTKKNGSLNPEEIASDPPRRRNSLALYCLPACVLSTIDSNPKIN